MRGAAIGGLRGGFKFAAPSNPQRETGTEKYFSVACNGKRTGRGSSKDLASTPWNSVQIPGEKARVASKAGFLFMNSIKIIHCNCVIVSQMLNLLNSLRDPPISETP